MTTLDQIKLNVFCCIWDIMHLDILKFTFHFSGIVRAITDCIPEGYEDENGFHYGEQP